MFDLIDKIVINVEKEVKNEYFILIVIGSDVVVKEQYLKVGEDVIINQKIFLKIDGKVMMLDMFGWLRCEVF